MNAGFLPTHEHIVYKHAYDLTALGYTVFPTHFLHQSGMCSCGSPTCTTNAGKHPMVRWSKLESPEGAIQEVHLAIGKHQWCNLGLITGKKRGPGPGLVAIDLDVKEGKNGIAAFKGWCDQHGIAPEELHTAWARTGSGGVHYLFLHPENDIKISSRSNILVIGGGIDVRGDGGYIIVAPSVHRSGGQYTWGVAPLPQNLRPLPAALLEALNSGSESKEPGRRKAAPYTPTIDDLIDLSTELERSKTSRSKNVGRAMKTALKGEPIAVDGGGHDIYRDILFFVGQRWPQAESLETLEHFRESVDARQRIRPDASCGMENLRDSLESAQAKAEEVESSWINSIAYTAKGEIKACEGNILTVLENHSDWRGVLAHNDRTQQTMFMKQPPIPAVVGPFPRAITDADGAQMTKWFTVQIKMSVTSKQCLPAAFSVGKLIVYDPFREWLEGLPAWDNIDRTSTWLIACANAADTPYTREASKRWLLQAVWRTYQPGCQGDYTLILQGAQGIKKSTLLAALVPDHAYFVDHLPPIGTKDATIALQGPVIVEIAELSAFKRSENEAMKAFLTTKYDSVRLPYDKLNTLLARRCILAGSTNDDAYLRDATGNRRYWPVNVGQCDPLRLTSVRDQLWAELRDRYRAGEPCYLDEESEALAKVEQAARHEGDSWEVQIDEWLAKTPPAGPPPLNYPHPDGITLPQIFEHALQLDDRAKWNRGAEMRVVAILKMRDYKRVRKNVSFLNKKCVWVYVKK